MYFDIQTLVADLKAVQGTIASDRATVQSLYTSAASVLAVKQVSE